jgi:hypothetical protein
MTALLSAIDRDPARTRRRWIGGVALAGAFARVGVYVARDNDDCVSGERAIADVWPAKTSLPKEVAAQLDAHAKRWALSHDAACRATKRDNTQSEAAMDLRMSCLALRKREFAAVTERVSKLDAAKAADAIDAVLALPSIAACDDVVGLQQIAPPPPEAKATVDAARAKLADGRAQLGLAPANEVVATIKLLAAEAESIGYAPLVGEAQLVLADALDRAGSHREAEVAFRAAASAADRAADDRTRFQAWSGLVSMLAFDVGRMGAARELMPLAEGALARTRGDFDLELLWDITVGMVWISDGKPREAAAKFTELMTTIEARYGANDPKLATAAAGYAAALQRYAAPAEVEAAAKRAAEIRARALGSSEAERREAQIQTANAKVFEAVPLLEQGKPADAIAILEPAIAELLRLGGPNHESVASAIEMLGHAYVDSNRFDEAVERHARAREIRAIVHGAESAEVASSLIELSRIALKQKDFPTAVANAKEALRLYEATRGPDSPKAGGAHLTLARALQAMNRLDDALPHATRAVAIGESVPWYGGALTVLGDIEVARGDVARGVITLEKALALRDASDWDKLGAATTRMALARARAKQGRARDAAALATRAEQTFTELNKPELAGEARAFAATL